MTEADLRRIENNNRPHHIGDRPNIVIAELIAEIRRLWSERQWRPISEAPRDSEPVLGGLGLMVFVMQWANGIWYSPEYCGPVEPTHFMRLPAGPEGR